MHHIRENLCICEIPRNEPLYQSINCRLSSEIRATHKNKNIVYLAMLINQLIRSFIRIARIEHIYDFVILSKKPI